MNDGRLTVGKYQIGHFDKRNLAIFEEQEVQTGKNKGTKRWVPIAYYTKLKFLVKDLVQRGLNFEEVKSLKELGKQIESSTKLIMNTVAPLGDVIVDYDSMRSGTLRSS